MKKVSMYNGVFQIGKNTVGLGTRQFGFQSQMLCNFRKLVALYSSCSYMKQQ